MRDSTAYRRIPRMDVEKLNELRLEYEFLHARLNEPLRAKVFLVIQKRLKEVLAETKQLLRDELATVEAQDIKVEQSRHQPLRRSGR
jgi:hypothetical protein